MIEADAVEFNDDNTGYRYCHDSNANQTHSYKNGNKTREVTYTGYDKPSSIWSVNAQTWFNYDAKHARFKRIDTDSDGTKTTYYVGGNEVVIHDSGLTEHKRYIADVALDILRSNGNHETNYLYRDHIGSLVVIADDSGNLVQRLAYDAFGKRREGLSWNPVQSLYANPSIQSALDITQKGFTDHEHVDHADIIHMGGRIYDPTLGRFIQADPIVQAPENGQSLNRYSYVFNNPLSYTDPTGYCAAHAFAWDWASGCSDQGRDSYVVPVDGSLAGKGQSLEQFDSTTNGAKANDKDTASASVANQSAATDNIPPAKIVPRSAWSKVSIEPGDLKANTKPYDTVTLHHSGSATTPAEVEKIHRNKEEHIVKGMRYVGAKIGVAQEYTGYGDVGYDFMIDEGGTIFEGRSLKYKGAHAYGHNQGNVGIAFLGDYTEKPLSTQQMVATIKLTTYLKQNRNINIKAAAIKTHGELDNTKANELKGAASQIDYLKKEFY